MPTLLVGTAAPDSAVAVTGKVGERVADEHVEIAVAVRVPERRVERSPR